MVTPGHELFHSHAKCEDRRSCSHPAARAMSQLYFTRWAVLLTTGAAGEAVGVVQVSHGLAGLAGSVHALPTFDADTCWSQAVS